MMFYFFEFLILLFPLSEPQCNGSQTTSFLNHTHFYRHLIALSVNSFHIKRSLDGLVPSLFLPITITSITSQIHKIHQHQLYYIVYIIYILILNNLILYQNDYISADGPGLHHVSLLYHKMIYFPIALILNQMHFEEIINIFINLLSSTA